MSSPEKRRAGSLQFLSSLWGEVWISRRAWLLFECYPKYISALMAKMEKDGYVSKKGKAKSRAYRITDKGRAVLRAYNPLRFGESDIVDGKKPVIRYAEDEIRRQSLRGVISCLFTLSGFGVHPHDKPPIGYARLGYRADRPTSSTLLAQTPEIPTELNSIHNHTDYRYHEPNKRIPKKERDIKTYRLRSTPVGCYYTRGELLEMVRQEKTRKPGQEQKNSNTQNVNASAVSGLLFSGNGAYKVYVTDNAAPKIMMSQDEVMTGFLKNWAGDVYKRSLEHLPSKNTNQQLRGSFLFGDDSYRAAISILEQTNLKALGKTVFVWDKTENTKNERALGTNYNLMDIPETFYIPYIREALPVCSALILPGWEIALRQAYVLYNLMEYPDSDGYKTNASLGLFDATDETGRLIVCMLPLKLDRIRAIVDNISSDSSGIVIYCPEYEMKFYDLLLAKIGERAASLFEIRPLPQDFIEHYFIGELQKVTGYDGPYPTDESNRWTKRARELGIGFNGNE